MWEAAQMLDAVESSHHPTLGRQWKELELLEPSVEKLELQWLFQWTLEPRKQSNRCRDASQGRERCRTSSSFPEWLPLAKPSQKPADT